MLNVPQRALFVRRLVYVLPRQPLVLVLGQPLRLGVMRRQRLHRRVRGLQLDLLKCDLRL